MKPTLLPLLFWPLAAVGPAQAATVHPGDPILAVADGIARPADPGGALQIAAGSAAAAPGQAMLESSVDCSGGVYIYSSTVVRNGEFYDKIVAYTECADGTYQKDVVKNYQLVSTSYVSQIPAPAGGLVLASALALLAGLRPRRTRPVR